MPTLRVRNEITVQGVGLGASAIYEATGSALLQVEESVADDASDYEIACVIDEDALVGLVIVSDQAVTVKTNSSGDPQETISLSANAPVLWFTEMGSAKPISDDLTALFVSNSSGSAATVRVVAITDATP